MAAANSWDSLAESYNDTATQWGSIVSDVATAWFGPSSESFQHAAAQQISWFRSMSAVAQHTAVQAQQAADAFIQVRSSIVPTTLIASNRAQLLTLIATNIFGQNTTAIAATEATYQEMWAQDAAAMSAYDAQSQAATTALADPAAGGLIGFLNGQGIGGVQGLGLLLNQYGQSLVSSAPVTNVTSVVALLALATLGADLRAANAEAQKLEDENPDNDEPKVFVPEPRPFTGKAQNLPNPPVREYEPYQPYTDPDRFYGVTEGGSYRVGDKLSVPPSWPRSTDVKSVATSSSTDLSRIGMPVLPFVPTINKPGGKGTPPVETKKRKLGVPIVTMRPPQGG